MDTELLRQQFAGLDTDMALFDNAGGSQILRSVVRRIGAYFEDCNVQHGASYGTSQLATARVTEAREGLAAWVNADPGCVVIGPSTTQLLRILAESLGRTLKSGDEVIVTNCDHEANIGPWMELERIGVKVRIWKIDPESLELRLADLDALMNELTAGLAGLWDYVEQVSEWIGADGNKRSKLKAMFDEFAQREAILVSRLLDFLRGRDKVRIIGPETADADTRVATVSFVVEGRNSEELVLAADREQIGIRFGDFYAYRLIDDLGLRPQGGVVRASFLHYNTEDEVDRLISALEREL